MKIHINKSLVGLRIKKIRLEKGYTLEEFGKLFNANKALVSKWTSGSSLPNKERLKGIAKLGDMTVNELLYGDVQEFVRENYNENRKAKDGTVVGYDYLKADSFILYCQQANIELNINNIENIISEFDKYNVEFEKGVEQANKNDVLVRTEKYDAFVGEKIHALLQAGTFIENTIANINYNFKADELEIINKLLLDLNTTIDMFIRKGIEGSFIVADKTSTEYQSSMRRNNLVNASIDLFSYMFDLESTVLDRLIKEKKYDEADKLVENVKNRKNRLDDLIADTLKNNTLSEYKQYLITKQKEIIEFVEKNQDSLPAEQIEEKMTMIDTNKMLLELLNNYPEDTDN